MNRKVVTAIFALSAGLAISALAQAQSSTGQQSGLTNPGFEEPRGEEASFTFVETMPGWMTTDTAFEIWSTGFQEFAAHEGTQFVELNARIDGTLYQDSTGIQPGSVLEFTFAHRGRNGDDTMKLTITDLGADNSLAGEDDTVLFTSEYTTGKDAWVVYDSTAEQKIQALGNTVRFAYSAVAGTGGRGPDKTEGNFLDAANFGVGVVSEAPPENAMKLDVDGGAFAFGYRTTAEPGFTEFPNTDSPHAGITRRNRSDGEYFSFAQNTLETELIVQETGLVHYPAKAEGSGVLCPGQYPGDIAIARFTAMDDGEYHFKITAQLIEEDPTGAGVTIYVDSQAVEETQLKEHLVPWTTSSVVKLKKGQTVDIAVDSGVDKNWEKDHVLITAKAWTTGPSIATNSIGMELKLIPAGTFMMGSPESEEGRDDDEQQHEVTITRDYYIGVTEVTQSQWQQVMGTTPWTEKGEEEGEDYAANYIHWDDAVEFCEKLSVKEGRTYRLPTEAEWEYACRAGSETAYSFGDEVESLGEYAWYRENKHKRQPSVGQKKPNAWGLYDMHGNLSEWCADWESAYPREAVTDPVGPAEGSDRVLRGGGFYDEEEICRTADRWSWSPRVGSNSYGFRLVLSSPSGQSPEADK